MAAGRGAYYSPLAVAVLLSQWNPFSPLRSWVVGEGGLVSSNCRGGMSRWWLSMAALNTGCIFPYQVLSAMVRVPPCLGRDTSG